jgi:4-amino-4-deoxy-L-arabinose transferase-like glycosyltransferase
VLLTVFAPSAKLSLLRRESGPASYSHDGGVIQTEATIDYLFEGRNPYVEDYVATPMAEWGINEFRTALYHYPYLPWTFLFSAPFRLLADRTIGWYDQRFVYLFLFALTLLLAPGLARRTESKLLLVMIIGLNPIMGSDLIYGQNDGFVLAWVLLSLWLWGRGRQVVQISSPGQETAPDRAGRGWLWASAAAFGLACASKPTAWFLLPFYLLLLAGGDAQDLWRRPLTWLRRACVRGWPALAVVVLVMGPYLVWDPRAMFDDVWRWSNGTSSPAYQIWGWGASNLVLAAGWVKSRFDYWPFWLPQLIIGLPLLVLLVRRQAKENSPARAFWSYGLFLLAFFFFSRFLNENYLGYITAILAVGTLADL